MALQHYQRKEYKIWLHFFSVLMASAMYRGVRRPLLRVDHAVDYSLLNNHIPVDEKALMVVGMSKSKALYLVYESNTEGIRKHMLADMDEFQLWKDVVQVLGGIPPRLVNYIPDGTPTAQVARQQ